MNFFKRLFRRKTKQNIIVGDKVKAVIMFDEYEFNVIDKKDDRLKLQWPTGNGTFWIDIDKVIIS